MEFPGLLSVLLNGDCSAQVVAEESRLKALATANGSNIPLIMYLNYFKKMGVCPTAADLISYAATVPKSSPETVAADLEAAAQWRSVNPNDNFELSLAIAWDDANRQYVKHGYHIAGLMSVGMLPPDTKGYKFDSRMKALYGEDEALWDRTAFSQLWLNEYLAANPFGKREVEEEAAPSHEFTLAQAVGVHGEGVANLSLTAINATDIKPEALKWLWQDRIGFGKITWYTGKPDCGKSLALLDLIARVTTGIDWPDGQKNILGPKSVLLACSEDGLADTIIPRLNAAGADLTRVQFIHRVVVQGEIQSQRLLSLDTDTQLLRKALKANPEIVLVALDPMTSFFGDVNINIDKDIRPVMDALSAVCNATGVCLISVIHHNKRSDVDALQKILGASSVAGAARTAWGFSRDPEDKVEFYMSLVKNNLSKRRTGMKYAINEKSVDGILAPYTEWKGETEHSANDLLDAERDTSGRQGNKKITLARIFIPAALSKGPRLAREMYGEAEAQGISEDALKRAVRELDVRVYKQGKVWMWSMAKEATPPSPEDVI